MNAEVIPLNSRRKELPNPCPCGDGFTCYSHRLVDLAARIEDIRGDIEQFRFCDWGTFQRMTDDVLNVLGGIVVETLPDERTAK